MNGNVSISPSRKAFIRRITSARLARWISGWVKGGRATKSSSEYKPNADAILDAAAAAFSLVGAALGDRLDRQPPGSCPRIVAAYTRQTGIDHVPDPGMVREVSAILVAMMTLRRAAGAKTRCCSRSSADRTVARSSTADPRGPPTDREFRGCRVRLA